MLSDATITILCASGSLSPVVNFMHVQPCNAFVQISRKIIMSCDTDGDIVNKITCMQNNLKVIRVSKINTYKVTKCFKICRISSS